LNGEQQYNIENLKRHGAALKLSKTFFQKEKLLKAIDEILEKYDLYLKKAQNLAYKFPKPEGDKNAAYIIQEITSNIK